MSRARAANIDYLVVVTHLVAVSGAAAVSSDTYLFSRHIKSTLTRLFDIMRLLTTLLLGIEAGQRRSERINERSLRWLDHKKCLSKENIKRSDNNGEGNFSRFVKTILDNSFFQQSNVTHHCVG